MHQSAWSEEKYYSYAFVNQIGAMPPMHALPRLHWILFVTYNPSDSRNVLCYVFILISFRLPYEK